MKKLSHLYSIQLSKMVEAKQNGGVSTILLPVYLKLVINTEMSE